MDNQNVSMTSKNLQDFPPEVLEVIFSWLPPKDIASVSQTCQKFNEITKGDQLWAKICFNQYKINVPAAKGFARRIYKNVLHSYGKLLGFWTLQVIYDGRLLQILYRDGQLLGQDLQIPRASLNPTDPLRPKTLFRIFMDEENNDRVAIKCCISPATLHQDMDLQYKEGHLVTKHIDEDVAERYEEEQCWRVWFLRLENNLNDNDEDIHVFDDGSWSSRYDLASAAHYSRLKLPLASTFAVPIRAGVFTAISAWPFQEHIHLSRQLVLLSYGEDEKTVQGLQITGDFNVQGVGALNFKSDLSQCVVLTQLTQDVNWKDLPPQPFVIPQMYLEQFPDLPAECLAKFQGLFLTPVSRDDEVGDIPLGLLAAEGYWIIFYENVFAFLATHDDYPLLTVYHRLQDPLLQELQS